MKNFTLLIAAAFIAVSSVAQTGRIRPATPTQRPIPGATVRTAPKAKAGLRSTAQPKAVQNDRPEGTLYTDWSYSAHVFFLDYFGTDAWQSDMELNGSEGVFVMSPDGSTIWLYEPLGGWLTHSYLRLDKSTEEDGVYVARFPQDIFEERYTPEEWYEITEEVIERDTVFTYTVMRVVAGQTEYQGEMLDDMVPDNVQEVRFAWDGKSLRQLDDVQIGAMDNEGLYAGYGAERIVLTAIDDEIAAVPDDAEVLPYALTYDNPYGGVEHKMVKVSFAGNTVYLSDLYNVNVEGWAKGTIEQDGEGNTYVVFRSPQYLGLDASGGYHVYFIAGYAEKFYDEENGYYDWNYEFKDEIRFVLDTEKRTLTANETGAAIYINAGNTALASYVIITNPVLKPYVEEIAVPADPIIEADYYYPYDASFGYGTITFYIKAEDINGNFLNSENLYYRLYADEDVMTFSPEDHPGLPAEVDELPYSFTNYDTVYAYEDYHQIVFFETGFSRLGVQAIYRSGGEERVSDIVYIGDETGISTPATATAGQGTAYDLQGRRTNAAAKGIYIVNGKKVLR